MNQSGKVVLGLLALGGIGALVFASGKANAAEPQPSPVPNPNPLPDLPEPALPPVSSVIPPAGTPIPVPGGGSVPVPSIPGLNTQPAAPAPAPAPLPNLPLPPLPAVLPVLPTVPGPAPSVVAPPASPAEVVSSAPADTIALVQKMLAQEANPHWRIAPEPLLTAWQKARGLTADGMFGTGTALALAKEIGTIPIIRAWPKGSYPGDGKLAAYQASLQQLAQTAPAPRSTQLSASAAREAGQGYGTPETPIVHLITVQA